MTYTEISDNSALLYRQAHPNFILEGRPSSQMFEVRKSDNGNLSVANGALTTAKKAFEHYTQIKKLKSAGSWAVLVSECVSNSLKAFESPTDADPAHAHVDLSQLGGTAAAKRMAKILTNLAIERGKQYPTNSPSNNSSVYGSENNNESPVEASS